MLVIPPDVNQNRQSSLSSVTPTIFHAVPAGRVAGQAVRHLAIINENVRRVLAALEEPVTD